MTPMTPAMPPLMILGTIENVWAAGTAVVAAPSAAADAVGTGVDVAVGTAGDVAAVSVADVMATAVAAENWSQLLQRGRKHIYLHVFFWLP